MSRPFWLSEAQMERLTPFFLNSLTHSSMSLHCFETVLFEMPFSPIAYTSSSTRRVETPPVQASWITAACACSDVLRASRKPGT